MSRLLFNISLSEYCNIYWKGWITYGSLIDVNATENRAEKKWWKKGIKSESEWTRAYEWERGAELKSWTRQICNVWFVDSLFDFAFLCQHSWLQFVLFVLHMRYRSVARIQMCKISNTITTCVTACFLRAISNILNAANATNPVITDRVFIKCNVFGLCLQLRNIFSFFPINYLPVRVDRNQIEDNLRKCLTTPHWKPLERESLPRFLNFYHLQTNESLSSTSNVGVKATI